MDQAAVFRSLVRPSRGLDWVRTAGPADIATQCLVDSSRSRERGREYQYSNYNHGDYLGFQRSGPIRIGGGKCHWTINQFYTLVHPSATLYSNTGVSKCPDFVVNSWA